ncbi:hypothetical protein PMAYCL1PPCAC_16855, partial [Pristionchus mayeri]
INLTLFFVMILHPLLHNITLLGITPTYRTIIKSFPRRLLARARFMKVMSNHFSHMIFLSAQAQLTLQTAERVVFCVTSLLNVVSLDCLIKETPPHQAKIRNYLIMTQIMVMVNSVYMDILFEPIPLFPATAGMCSGVLCKAGLPPHSVLVLYYVRHFLLVVSFFHTINSVFQTIL